MYDIILFDLDGTLIDSGLGITNSAMYALSKYDIHIENRESLRSFIGPPLIDSFMNTYGFSEEKAREAIEVYREYYGAKGVFEITVYDGLEALLAKLKNAGKTIILATSKYEFYALQILENIGFAKYFDFAVGSNQDGSRGTKAEIISYILESQNITDKSKVVMIGDRKHDIIGAKTLGIDSIGVLYGFGDREELETHGATHIAKNAEEIWTIVK
ncbi:MAG: HAD-IA family hydrolase [Clostridia bacterium]|nr:HAD-IA family hydrolase [Clostridia bacterium]